MVKRSSGFSAVNKGAISASVISRRLEKNGSDLPSQIVNKPLEANISPEPAARKNCCQSSLKAGSNCTCSTLLQMVAARSKKASTKTVTLSKVWRSSVGSGVSNHYLRFQFSLDSSLKYGKRSFIICSQDKFVGVVHRQ